MKLIRFQPTIRYLEEPLIEVGEGIAVPEPKMGWSLLGPYGSRSEKYVINVALIGNSESIEKCKDLIEKLKLVTFGKDNNFLHANFPGLNKMRLEIKVIWTSEIEDKDLGRMDNAASLTESIEIAYNIIKERIDAIVERDPAPDIIVVAYPKKIDYYCIERAVGHKHIRIKTAVEKRIEGVRKKHKPLDEFLGYWSPVDSFRPRDLRSMLKLLGMQHDVPIQIVRPKTTERYDPNSPIREDDATVFWNLVVAIFFKTNHIPWRVKGLMEDTCYIGITFFRDREDSASVRTALAQIFVLESEGFVIKGQKTEVDEYNAPHLSKADTINLTARAIEVYSRNKDGQTPKRIVVHKTSRFNDNEMEGFNAGALGIHRLDLVAFGTREIKMMRWGKHPPIRRTMVKLPDDSILLYTFGYIPYFDVYPGPRVPSPLEILEHHGQTSNETICREIMSLTKLNWNNAKFCSKAPITIAFARRIGSIIREIPPNTDLSNIGTKLKFYM